MKLIKIYIDGCTSYNQLELAREGVRKLNKADVGDEHLPSRLWDYYHARREHLIFLKKFDAI